MTQNSFFTSNLCREPLFGSNTANSEVDAVFFQKKNAQNLAFDGIQKLHKTLKPQEVLGVAHHNTILRQLLDLVPRHEFDSLASEYMIGRSPRKFSYWSQFACLVFIHLSARKSLRDGVRNLCANISRLYHLGVGKVARSTFSDANNARSAEFFKALFGKLYLRASAAAPGHKFRFRPRLFSLDASTIKLNLESYPWAVFRKKRGGIKLHLLLDHDGYIPAFALVTDAKRHEAKVARTLELPKGSIVVFDRGYIDFNWFKTLTKNQIFFVTRQKKNMVYSVITRRKVVKGNGLTSDQDILVNTAKGPLKLRRVGYRDPETGTHYKFLTNRFDLAAQTIADIYRDRWQIETFFRFIKQNLKIKSFVGRSENAVLIQIYVAMIACLLIALMKFRSKLGWGFQEIAQLLQINLFQRIPLDSLFAPPGPEREKSNYVRQIQMQF